MSMLFGRQSTDRCWQEAGANLIKNGTLIWKYFNFLKGGLIAEEHDKLLNVLHLSFHVVLIRILSKRLCQSNHG